MTRNASPAGRAGTATASLGGAAGVLGATSSCVARDVVSDGPSAPGDPEALDARVAGVAPGCAAVGMVVDGSTGFAGITKGRAGSGRLAATGSSTGVVIRRDIRSRIAVVAAGAERTSSWHHQQMRAHPRVGVPQVRHRPGGASRRIRRAIGPMVAPTPNQIGGRRAASRAARADARPKPPIQPAIASQYGNSANASTHRSAHAVPATQFSGPCR